MQFKAPAVADLLDFAGKTVVVTGASAGIGAGIVARFAEAGANVVFSYRNDQEGAVALATGIGPRAITVRADVNDDADVEALMRNAKEKCGSLDVLINNAGLQTNDPFMDLSGEHVDAMMRTNVGGPFRCTQAAVRLMPETGGAVVNVSSISGLEPAFTHAHYCASKAALSMMTRAAALELGPRNVRVNAVLPGLIWRDDLDKTWPEGLARWMAHVPLGRCGESEDVADACLFLASPAARFITGALLNVDGGVTTHPSY